MRRHRIPALLLACAAIPVAIATGCDGGDDGGDDVEVGPAAAVPRNTPLYLDATVKPTGSAEEDAKAALGKVLDTDDPGAKIVDLIEDEAKSDGHPIDFQRDLAPWLGEKAGVFFTDLAGDTVEGTVVVETTDPAAALALARKSTGADTAAAPSTIPLAPSACSPSHLSSMLPPRDTPATYILRLGFSLLSRRKIQSISVASPE